MIELPSSPTSSTALGSWKASFVYGYFAWALFVHFRGQVRHKFHRQLTDHSTIIAPVQRDHVRLLRGARTARSSTSTQFPELQAAAGQLADDPRGGAQALRRGPHPRAPRSTTTSASTRSSAAAGSASTSSGTTRRSSRRWRCARRRSSSCSRSRRSTARCSRCCRAGGDLGRHRDPFAGSLRYHLGLVTPNSDACRIWVDGQEYSWRDGEAVMFDETFIHWAENRTRRRPADPVLRRRAAADEPHPEQAQPLDRRPPSCARRQTENAPGDKVGLLNRIFGFAYYLRLPGKSLKKKSKFAVLRGEVADRPRHPVPAASVVPQELFPYGCSVSRERAAIVMLRASARGIRAPQQGASETHGAAAARRVATR